MPLPPLILDDRTYQQLRDELVRRIPAYTPEWTDHNASDPGITLIELFAVLGENLLYRLNQIPDATRLGFLRLLQIPLRPATAASAMVALTPRQPLVDLVRRHAELRAGEVKFATLDEARVLPVTCLAVCKQETARPDAAEEAERDLSDQVDQVLTTLRLTDPRLAGSEPSYYQSVATSPDGSGPPVDFGKAVDGLLWVPVLAAGDADPGLLSSLLLEHPQAPLTLSLGFVPDLQLTEQAEPRPCPGDDQGGTGPAVEWQISSGQLRNDLPTQPVYHRLKVIGDTTQGLTQRGVVQLELPRPPATPGVFALELDDELAGTGELPPPLADQLQPQLLFWLRAFRPDGSRVGRVQYVGANCVEAGQWTRAGLEFLGTGDGQPQQTFALVHRPVIAGSLQLQVEASPDQWEDWTEVDAFHASRRTDRHYTLDRESGQVRFGDAARGAVPQIGQRIRAAGYRYGGGVAGNVAAGLIAKITGHPGIRVTNPLPATGGSETETIGDALARIPAELRRRERAVTSGDFRELALATPGADIGRAECLPRFEPRSRITDAAGVVTVVVWPRQDARRPSAPLPDRDQLRRVCRYLDERRLVTTELYVVPPRYRKIAVSVGLSAKPGYGIDGVRLWVELVLRQYLAPLPPYGPEGAGWPLGRRVYGPELEAVALQVEGVRALEGAGLLLAGWDAAQSAWVPGPVTLAVDEVPELERISVVEGDPLPPGELPAPILPAAPIVPVPVLREEC
ncbi:MAG: putative baseplate assembly protein [Pirellulaceae bacterium]|nr:putative baseplate assembly protein [Pirellulaceae bacterium]